MPEKDRSSKNNEIGDNPETGKGDNRDNQKREKDKILGILKESIIKSPRRKEGDKDTD